MKILIKGCFQQLAFHLVNHLLDDGFEIYGQDEYETDEDKFERYALVGRNASFHLFKNLNQEIEFDCYYDFTSEEYLCEFSKDGKDKVSILLENTNVIELDNEKRKEASAKNISIDQMTKLLSNLKDTSKLPNNIKINGNDQYSIHFIE